MKRILLFISLLFIGFSSYSSHFRGADIRLVNLLNTQGQPSNFYKFVVRYYASSPASFVTTIYIKTRLKNAGNVINTFGCIKSTTPQLASITNNNCNTYLPVTNVYYADYESTPYDMSSYNELDNYYVNIEDIAGTYLNIDFNGNSIEHYTEFPRLNISSPYKFNSSPNFNNHPLFYTCVGNPVSIDYSASDANGDSLAYSLIVPPSTGLVQPTFKSGYSISKYIVGNPDLSINSKTGLATFNPNLSGNYIVAVKIEEFRNGQKIGEVVKQHEITVIPSCGTNYTDVKPKFFFNNDSTRTQLQLSTNSVGSSLEVLFYAYDNGLIKDSIYIEANSININGKDLRKVDTSKYNWQILENGIFKNVGKSSINVSGKSNITIRFVINFHPALFDSLSGTYNFSIRLKDSKCTVANIDSTQFSLDFNKNPSIDTVSNVFAKKGNNATFKAIGTNLVNVLYQWQTDVGFGFQNLINNSNYSNVRSQNLLVNNIQLRNHEQKFRCIVNLGSYADTSAIAQLYVLDSTIVYVYDTILVSVTDTLIINLLPLSLPPIELNIVKIYPNPTTGKLFISSHPSNQLQNFEYKIINPIGQNIYQDDFSMILTEIDLSKWSLKGLYLFNIHEKSTGKLVESKKIVFN